MRNEDWLALLVSLWPLGYLKIFILVLIAFYIIFSAVCYRQIESMNKMVEAQTFPIIKMVGFLHLLAGLGLFILALVIL